jgi:hypothetical protein
VEIASIGLSEVGQNEDYRRLSPYEPRLIHPVLALQIVRIALRSLSKAALAAARGRTCT